MWQHTSIMMQTKLSQTQRISCDFVLYCWRVNALNRSVHVIIPWQDTFLRRSLWAKPWKEFNAENTVGLYWAVFSLIQLKTSDFCWGEISLQTTTNKPAKCAHKEQRVLTERSITNTEREQRDTMIGKIAAAPDQQEWKKKRRMNPFCGILTGELGQLHERYAVEKHN